MLHLVEDVVELLPFIGQSSHCTTFYNTEPHHSGVIKPQLASTIISLRGAAVDPKGCHTCKGEGCAPARVKAVTPARVKDVTPARVMAVTPARVKAVTSARVKVQMSRSWGKY